MAERAAADDLLEQMKQLRVSDLLLDMSMSLISLGFMRVGREARDLDQARLATDALGALVPLLRDRVPEELSRDLGHALANLQLAYAEAAQEEASATRQQEPQGPTAAASATTPEEPPAEGGEAASA